MTQREKKNDNLIGIILLVIILVLLVCGGYFVCNNFSSSEAVGASQFGKVNAAEILGMGNNFNY